MLSYLVGIPIVAWSTIRPFQKRIYDMCLEIRGESLRTYSTKLAIQFVSRLNTVMNKAWFRVFQKTTLLVTLVFATFVITSEHYTFKNAGEAISWTTSEPRTLRDTIKLRTVDETVDGETVGVSRTNQQWAVYLSPDLLAILTAACWALCGAVYLGHGIIFLAVFAYSRCREVKAQWEESVGTKSDSESPGPLPGD
ncbi:MAG: hypothetical protein UX89_C0017G0008 [Parcubacteria group bacterium GW2011_GWA2_47_16]|nr:MAG: hypothetical protein UX89_C0017G0008 [Parcubacteria group bacterium GW2011_GWA2_47_16]